MSLFKSIFLDTNILIYQTFEDLDNFKYLEVMNVLKNLTKSGSDIFISSQVLREFFAISTNTKIFQRPLNIKEAVFKLEEYQANFNVFFDTQLSFKILKKLIIDYEIERQKIHDANIAATVIANNIEGLFTYNKKDFQMFKEIKLL